VIAVCFGLRNRCVTADSKRPDLQLQDGRSVRVRILKSMAGVLDGVSLGHLLPGLTYDLDESLAGYLLSIRSAEAVPDAESPLSQNSDESLFEHVIRGVTITNRGHRPERAVGDDRPRRIPRKRR
jgi:hypothetical protein